MSIFNPKPAPEPAISRRLRERAQENLRREYSKGLEDGTILVLDALLGDTPVGGGAYAGPVPDELRSWIDGLRVALDVTKER